MNNAELLSQISADLDSARAQGNDSVPVAGMQAYLASLSQALTKDPQALDTFALERIKSARDLALANLKRSADLDLEMLRSVIASGQSALRAAMAINGLAASALLAFLGSALARQAPPGFVGAFAGSLAAFVAGVLAATVAYGSNYVSQWCYHNNHERTGHGFNLVSIGLTLSSYVGFGFAAWRLFTIFAAL